MLEYVLYQRLFVRVPRTHLKNASKGPWRCCGSAQNAHILACILVCSDTRLFRHSALPSGEPWSTFLRWVLVFTIRWLPVVSCPLSNHWHGKRTTDNGHWIYLFSGFPPYDFIFIINIVLEIFQKIHSQHAFKVYRRSFMVDNKDIGVIHFMRSNFQVTDFA